MSGRVHQNYRNPCLTMHQPWASLLVHGIKRIEGRSWSAPIRGRIWIHAAGKVPDPSTIKAMEVFYREIYAVNGITDIKFPDRYPVSRLLGCVEIVGCVKCEELVCWKEVPEGVRLEGQTNFCWLCEQPQKLLVPFEMRGFQGVYNLEKKIYEAAIRGLCRVEGPLPVKFPLPNPSDRFSLKPGSVAAHFTASKSSEVEKSPSLNAAIAAARAASTQFSKKEQSKTTTSHQQRFTQKIADNADTSRSNNHRVQDQWQNGLPDGRHLEQKSNMNYEVNSSRPGRGPRNLNQQPSSMIGGPHKIFALSLKELRQSNT